MKKIIAMILCVVMLLPILAGCSRSSANIATNSTEPPELQYPDLWYLEREEFRFDLDEIDGFKTPGMEEVVNKGKPIRTPMEGKLLAETILNELQSSGQFLDYIPAYVEYATKEKVWLFCYETTASLVMGSTMYYVVVDSRDGSLIAHWNSGKFGQQETTEQMAVQYPETRYYEVEECQFDLNAIEHKKHPRLEAFLSEGKSVQSPWAGKLLAEKLLLNELQTWSDVYQDYVPSYVEYATEEKTWIFGYITKESLSDGQENDSIYIAVDGMDGSLITYWYDGTNPPEGLEEGNIPDMI